MREEIGQTAYGKQNASTHDQFVGAYALQETERGKHIVGSSPDGRHDFMCMRCGRSLKSVYVFTSDSKQSFMHVGIDCAQSMGIPMAELRKANDYFDGLERADRARISAAQRAASEAARAAEEHANISACREMFAEIEAMLSNPATTLYERDVLRNALAACRANPKWFACDWVIDALNEWHLAHHHREHGYAKLSAQLESVRERLRLVATSVAVTGKQITGAFRAYRPHISFETQYGTTYVSFLTDDCGHAFFVKSSEFIVRQGCTVIATFSLGEAEQRDGLTATRLLRPRKIDPNCGHPSLSGWSLVSLQHDTRARMGA
jgi:hypothetical protein